MSGYKVPDWRKSIGQNMYDVEVEGYEFTIPRAEYLTTEQVEKLGNSGELGLIRVLNDICPAVTHEITDETTGEPHEVVDKPGLGDAFAPVPIKFANEFVAAWQKDSQIELGESEASGDS